MHAGLSRPPLTLPLSSCPSLSLSPSRLSAVPSPNCKRLRRSSLDFLFVILSVSSCVGYPAKRRRCRGPPPPRAEVVLRAPLQQAPPRVALRSLRARHGIPAPPSLRHPESCERANSNPPARQKSVDERCVFFLVSDDSMRRALDLPCVSRVGCATGASCSVSKGPPTTSPQHPRNPTLFRAQTLATALTDVWACSRSCLSVPVR